MITAEENGPQKKGEQWKGCSGCSPSSRDAPPDPVHPAPGPLAQRRALKASWGRYISTALACRGPKIQMSGEKAKFRGALQGWQRQYPQMHFFFSKARRKTVRDAEPHLPPKSSLDNQQLQGGLGQAGAALSSGRHGQGLSLEGAAHGD